MAGRHGRRRNNNGYPGKFASHEAFTLQRQPQGFHSQVGPQSDHKVIGPAVLFLALSAVIVGMFSVRC